MPFDRGKILTAYTSPCQPGTIRQQSNDTRWADPITASNQHRHLSACLDRHLQMVLVRSHAERIVVLLDDAVVAEHVRQFRRHQIVYDPWHYLPVLMRKPGALRNGAPFKDWDLPDALSQVRAKLQRGRRGRAPRCRFG